MRHPILLFLSLALATSLTAGPVPDPPETGFRSVAVFAAAPWEENELGLTTPELTLAKAIGKLLEKEGLEVTVLSRTVDSLVEDGLEESVRADIFVEIVADARGESWGGIGGGGRTGDVYTGATVEIVRSAYAAEVRIHDGRTRELLDTFTLRSRAFTPALSSISLGGDHAWFTIGLPWFERQTSGRAANALAKKVVAEIERAAEQLGARQH